MMVRMRLLLLLQLTTILVVFQRCHADSCKTVFCPEQSGKSISCDTCHACLDAGARYCFTADHKNCRCATIVPETCELTGNGANYTFCHLLDDISVPAPEVLAHDEHSVSAVVPRFFQEPPFDDSLKPSFLYLLASFAKNGTECSTIGHIEAFHRSQDKCLLRVRVQMPKIDYTGHDNYYYDDRSALESQFSRELFGASATNVTFWTEVTIRKVERLKNNASLSFATVLKSARVDFEL